MDFLNKKGNYTEVDTPDLLLLDINLPKRNGHEVLQYLKGNENLKHIPVVILTTSSADKDINLSYNNYVNCFITKPVEVNDFLNIVSTIENFWISVVKLPTKRI
jgi:CheY-like chemotaxis protein